MYMRLLRILGAHIYILFIPSHYFGTLRLVAPFQVQTLHRYLHMSASWTFYQASEYLHLPWVTSRGWSRVEAPRKLRGSWVESTRLLRRGLVWDVWGCSDDFYLHFCCSSPVSQRGTWLNLCLFWYYLASHLFTKGILICSPLTLLVLVVKLWFWCTNPVFINRDSIPNCTPFDARITTRLVLYGYRPQALCTLGLTHLFARAFLNNHSGIWPTMKALGCPFSTITTFLLVLSNQSKLDHQETLTIPLEHYRSFCLAFNLCETRGCLNGFGGGFVLSAGCWGA